MIARLTLPFTILFMVLGSLLFFNGIFHVLFYLIDDKPMLSGLRHLNWISLFLGIGIFYIGLLRMSRK